MTAALFRWPFVAAGVLYAVVALALVSPALVPGKAFSTSDQLRLMEPWLAASPPAFERAALPASENSDTALVLRPFLRHAIDRLPQPPLWNPHIMSGRPLLADAQSSPFSPFSLPAYVLPDLTAPVWIALFKLWSAAIGTFALGRALGMRPGGAFVAGLVYGFSFWIVAYVTWPHASVWALIPWMLLAAERLVRRPDLVSGAALAGVTALQSLGGHPESSFHAVAITVLFFALRLVQSRRAGEEATRRLIRPLLSFCAALAGGGLLAALVIFPFIELLLNSSDLEDRQGTAIDAHRPTRFLLAIFLPDYWGRATRTLTEPFQLTRTLYAGALSLMLAVATLLLRPRAERVAFAALGGISLAVVFGLPPFLQIVTRLPILSSGHNRFAVFWVLSVALLAGWGLDDLTSRAGGLRGRRRVLQASGIVLAIPAVWVIVGGPSLDGLDGALGVASGLEKPRYPLEDFPEVGDQIRLAALLVWLAFGGAALLLLALRVRGRLGIAAFTVLATALLVADLLKAGMGYNPAIDRTDAALPESGVIRTLESDRGSRFVSLTRSFPDNVISLRSNLAEAGGYDLPLIERYDRLWRTQIEPECPSQVEGQLGPYCIRLTFNVVTPEALHTLRMLAVRYVLQPVTQPPLDSPDFRLVYDGSDGRVYRLVDALPRAWVAGAQRIVAGEREALEAVTAADFDPRQAIVSEKRLEGIPVGARTQAGRARVVRSEPERVTVRTQLSRPGVLVLADTWFPGWEATVDDRDVEVSQVDYVLRGVPLSAGPHTVEFRYRPLSWRLGWIVSAVALLGLVTALAVGLRRRRSLGRRLGLR